jgi:hypothetical protein
VLDSLALAYRRAIGTVQELSGRPPRAASLRGAGPVAGDGPDQGGRVARRVTGPAHVLVRADETLVNSPA